MKKLDNRGFTIIELITSFSLTMVILVFLFNIVIILKENFVYNSLKSELIINQSLMSTALNEDLYNEATGISSTSCSSGYDKCYNIELNNGTTRKLSISMTRDKVQYGDSVFSNENLEMHEYKVCYYNSSSPSEKKAFLRLYVKFKSDLFEEQNFGFNVLVLYNPNVFSISGISGC